MAQCYGIVSSGETACVVRVVNDVYGGQCDQRSVWTALVVSLSDPLPCPPPKAAGRTGTLRVEVGRN